jgi:hypothetical protein
MTALATMAALVILVILAGFLSGLVPAYRDRKTGRALEKRSTQDAEPAP